MLSHGFRNFAQSPALMRLLRHGVVSLKSSITCSPSCPDWNSAYSHAASVFLLALISDSPTVTPRIPRAARAARQDPLLLRVRRHTVLPGQVAHELDGLERVAAVQHRVLEVLVPQVAAHRPDVAEVDV